MSNQPNFSEMNKSQLRQYVLEHVDDDEAFYAFMDKMTENGPGIRIRSMEHLAELVRERENLPPEQPN